MLLFVGVGILIVAAGVPLALRKVPPNRLYGLRIPSTLRNEDVWYGANQATGRFLLVVGTMTACVAAAPGRTDFLVTPSYRTLHDLSSRSYPDTQKSVPIHGWARPDPPLNPSRTRVSPSRTRKRPVPDTGEPVPDMRPRARRSPAGEVPARSADLPAIVRLLGGG
jgi:hypothetical protein